VKKKALSTKQQGLFREASSEMKSIIISEEIKPAVLELWASMFIQILSAQRQLKQEFEHAR
jgi:hypothetical protein